MIRRRTRLRICLAAVWSLCAAAAGLAAPRVVIVDVDGVRRDMLEAAYLGGHCPNFARLMGDVQGGHAFTTARWYDRTTAVFPTVTLASQASIFTGAVPARHGIPGNQWFDRESGQLVRYLDSASVPCVYGLDLFNQGGCGGGLANRHLTAPTLYEMAAAAGKTSTVVYSQFYRGATRLILPSLGDIARRRKGVAANYAKFDASMVDAAIASLRRDGVPDILTVYFSAADEVGHMLGIAAERLYLEATLDAQLGKLLDAIAGLDPDWRAHTMFVIASDHGSTESDAASEAVDVEAAAREALAGAGFDGGRSQVAENGGMLYIYVRARAAGSRWADVPPEKEVIASAEALSRAPKLKPVTYALAVRPRGPGSGYAGFAGTALSPELLRLLNAVDCARSGDLVLLCRPGRYVPGKLPAPAHHGSIFAPDLGVPIVLALGGTSPGRSPVPIATVDLVKIIAEYLGI